MTTPTTTTDALKSALASLREATPEYPAEMMQARRNEILAAYASLTPEAQQAVRDELAELECSDDRPSTQWREHGYF